MPRGTKRKSPGAAAAKAAKYPYPDDFYEMRARLSEEEAEEIRKEVSALAQQLRAKKKKLRQTKPRKVLREDKLREIRQKSAAKAQQKRVASTKQQASGSPASSTSSSSSGVEEGGEE